MKAVTWHGKRDVRVDTVPGPLRMGHANVKKWVAGVIVAAVLIAAYLGVEGRRNQVNR